MIKTHRCGKHKIFIGMSLGVGKTYQMLEEGHRLRSEGITDVKLLEPSPLAPLPQWERGTRKP